MIETAAYYWTGLFSLFTSLVVQLSVMFHVPVVDEVRSASPEITVIYLVFVKELRKKTITKRAITDLESLPQVYRNP